MTSVEYLTITQKTNTFCNSEATFNKLLQVDSSLTITGGKIIFNESFSCDYQITSGEVHGKEQRYFHTKFSIGDETEDSLLEFSEFLKKIRTIISKVGNPPETLWDDISLHYSRLAYNIIHRIENLMRKLIANFMLTTVGVQWVDETAPSEIKEVIGKGKRNDYINVLHNIDFIHLADFLIKPYSNTSQADLTKLVRNATTLEDIASLKRVLPESNWNRYFSALVKCEDSYLQKRWTELYELRCKVAHNAIVSRQDYDQITLLSRDLEEKINDALLKLPQLKVPEAEVTDIAENAAENSNSLLGDFVTAWRILERHVQYKAAELGTPTDSITKAAEALREAGTFDETKFNALRRTFEIRNHVIHPTELTMSELDLRGAIATILLLIETIGYFEDK
jgi:hypothetical protein